jgi:hypothetical protein
MSRRRHGRPHYQGNSVPDGPRRVAGVSPAAPGADSAARPAPTGLPAPRPLAPPIVPTAPPLNGAPAAHIDEAARTDGAPQAHLNGGPLAPVNGVTPFAGPPTGQAGPFGQTDQPHGPGERNGQCTAPQLRRFIKSRPYVPMHELRRRFGIDGDDDDVTPVRLDPGWVYVGLPRREGSLLGDLLKAGEIGYELSLDPRTPIVIGVYPMRPIPRG